MVCNRAMFDPNGAWKDALELRSYELDQGISQSQVLYFISTTDGFKTPESTGESKGSASEENIASSGGTNGGSEYCWDHSACKEMGLTGQCCPTPDGTKLSCCDSNESQSNGDESSGDNELVTSRSGSQACSSNKGCASLGLSGLCCPALSGSNLSCCD